MKNILLAGAAAFALTAVSQAQVTEWVLFQQPGDQTATPATFSAPGLNGLAMTRGAGINPTAASNSISGNGWDTLAADDYFSFGFTVEEGNTVVLDELWLATRSSNTGPGFVGLTYSGDNFETVLATFVQSGTFFTNSIVDLSGLGSLSGTVEFRVISLGSVSANGGLVGSGGTLRISEHYDGENFTPVRFTGSVAGGGGLGTPFCFGDGSGTACPCGNFGAPGQGCANGSGQGATLGASGSASVAAADLVLVCEGLVPNKLGLFYQGDQQAAGGAGVVFGDGLRCAGVNIRRLQVVTSDAAGVSSTTVDVALEGLVLAGQTRTYQVWYRDNETSLCGTTFNLSSGLELTWLP